MNQRVKFYLDCTIHRRMNGQDEKKSVKMNKKNAAQIEKNKTSKISKSTRSLMVVVAMMACWCV